METDVLKKRDQQWRCALKSLKRANIFNLPQEWDQIMSNNEPSQEPVKIGEALLRVGNETVLLIDDEPMMIRLVTKMFTKSGYKVVSFLDAKKALLHFATQGQDYDLVITDYDMPNLNGNELAEQLNGMLPNIPIILMTGCDKFVNEQSRHFHSIVGVLKKPFKHQEINNLLTKALNT